MELEERAAVGTGDNGHAWLDAGSGNDRPGRVCDGKGLHVSGRIEQLTGRGRGRLIETEDKNQREENNKTPDRYHFHMTSRTK